MRRDSKGKEDRRGEKVGGKEKMRQYGRIKGIRGGEERMKEDRRGANKGVKERR